MGPKQILLADTDPEVQTAVERMSQRHGIRILTASTGAEVKKVALEQPLDLIVLEVALPDADGRDILAHLKRDARTKQIPVLLWSTRDPESDRRIALDLGAEDYVEKGDAQLLFTKIQRLLLRLDAT